MTGLTRKAGRFVANLRYADIPPDAVAVALTGITDCVSVILLGIDEPVTAVVAQGAPKGADEAIALWGRLRTTADHAALINATAAHALDYDDTSGDSHPSAVLLPAILALGEPFASGRDILTAYVAGYEVWTELASRDRDKHHSKGFHPTGIFGSIGAAAACANLLGLGEDRARAAMAIAASMSAGLVANFGTMTKPYQLGRAAQSGVLAAQMAARGMTANDDALEHPRGFLAAFSPGADVDLRTAADFGCRWRILSEGLNIKLYPVCYAAHRLISSAVPLHRTLSGTMADIRAIRVFLGTTQSQILQYRRPDNALEAKFSAEFAVAAALLAGNVGLGELDDGYVNRPEVRNLMARVTRIEYDEVDPEQSLFSPADHLEIELTDDQLHAGARVRFAPGHTRNPVDPARLRAKFDECTEGQLGERPRQKLFSTLGRLAELDSISALYDGVAAELRAPVV
jgi:2-methylcitrate dehydratase PrpD